MSLKYEPSSEPQRVVKDEEGIETGVMGTVELLNSRNFSTQPINSFDWSNDKVPPKREFFIDNLLVRIHCIIVMIRWTSLATWEFEFPFPGSFTSTFLAY